ncbi:DEAD/DEAH box helicase [Pseudoalteromonas tunicata]|uniref:DEAD/DEAH box helicase n=1 Tax=Pseudoalteromonas tunicata TaxID=314281 RepID=UPI00273F52DC|nr:DEAD/DEAH box helicase [Pseudoalteromonas tunicata]MDP5214007.1 DEAD/DEAH box helicase [Pseudoalteromonas tunicata]
MGFAALGLNQQLVQALTECGYDTPTPIQTAAIGEILQGKDVMAGAQTGTGKTAAFALPILQRLAEQPERKGQLRTLVLTPTRELAQQVFASFEKYGQHSELTAALAYGGVSIGEQIKAIKAGVDIMVATPGRLLDHLVKGTVNLSSVQYLVFDEADRMLDMGFIDEINNILRRLPKERQTLLFSATFDDAIFKLSKKLLNQPVLIEVNQRNQAASEVEQIVYAVDADRKRELISHLIGAKNWQQVLVFTRTKQTADELAKEMCKDGLKTQAIHGDKSQGARDKALSEFKEGKTRVLVATDVAARGIDIQQLQYVINYELPYIAEDYIHRIGRTGRAGEKGLAISLLSIDENWLLEEIEAVLDKRLPQQWLPGYEPDLTKEPVDKRKNGKVAEKRRAKKRLSGQKTGNRAQRKR